MVKQSLIENCIDDTVMAVMIIFLWCNCQMKLFHLRPCKPINFQDTYLKVTTGTQRRIVEGETTISLTITNVFVHPNRLSFPVVNENRIKYTSVATQCKLRSKDEKMDAYPPPIVIILWSAARNSSAEWSSCFSPGLCSMPTQGYLARSG